MSIPIEVHQKEELCVYGKDIKRIRYLNNISIVKACEEMNKRGWAYYSSKLFRLENKKIFCLPGEEAIDLIESIGGSIKL